MNKLPIFLLFITVLVFSCSRLDDDFYSQKENLQNEEGPCRTLPEALELADNFFAEIGLRTRGNLLSNISVEYISTPLTRNASPDTILYLVNYGDNDGFALLGAKKASYDIYAISPTGHLSMNDTVKNKALAHFINTAQMNASLPWEDSINISGWAKYSYKVIFKVAPMLGSTYDKWTQFYPYNKYCPKLKNGANAQVGCGPLSLGILLAYYKYPDNFKDFTFEWDTFVWWV